MTSASTLQMTSFFSGNLSLCSRNGLFDVLGVRYACGEQLIMSEKAKLFGDMTSYDKIMAATDPKTHKFLGRNVRPFDYAEWERRREEVVLTGSYAKFAQNHAMKHHLLETGTRLLAEASPFDRVWGIGMSACFPGASDSSKWAASGKNLLGKALMEVRRLLRDHPLSAEDFPASNSPTPPISQPPLHGHRRIHEVATATGSSLRKDPGEDPTCLRLDAPGFYVIIPCLPKISPLPILPRPPFRSLLSMDIDAFMRLLLPQVLRCGRTQAKTRLVYVWTLRETMILAFIWWHRPPLVQTSLLFSNMGPIWSAARSCWTRTHTPPGSCCMENLQPLLNSREWALTHMPPPMNVKQLRSLLGGLSYYLEFLKNLATKVPLDKQDHPDRRASAAAIRNAGIGVFVDCSCATGVFAVSGAPCIPDFAFSTGFARDFATHNVPFADITPDCGCPSR
ncbi:unnamed protein product [Ectocarpus sp. CCAP 1310/34]|nr:unnamed protein product [Ectocarpus sp. CCAP 1310/34]